MSTLDWREKVAVALYRYGKIISAAILALLAGISAREYWLWQQNMAREALTEGYSVWQEAVDEGHWDRAKAKLEELWGKYPGFVLTQLMQARQAKQDLRDKNFDEFEKRYAAIFANCHFVSTCDMHHLRYARHKLNLKDWDQAKMALAALERSEFMPHKNLYLGDIAFANQDWDAARAFWKDTEDLLKDEKGSGSFELKSQLTYRLQKLYEVQTDQHPRST